MVKKILYWAPCLNKVGTYYSTINSAISIEKYSKGSFKPVLLMFVESGMNQKIY